MENKVIKGSRGVYFIPTVNFDAEIGVCELAGESFLEDTVEFYGPLIQWIKDFLKLNKPITFNFKLTYFNTSSSRSILDILNLLKNFERQGGQVAVNWHFDERDIDMEEEIEDYMIESELEINMIPY
jgi:hypothetical protein